MNNLNRSWKDELDFFVEKPGTTLEEVCSYLSIEYSQKIGFYSKIPRKRKMFIGIGMAFKLPLENINDWIVRYGEKRKLYAKDILEDLIWIYLINCNERDKDSRTNYYSLFEKCRHCVQDTYYQIWNEYISHSDKTVNIDAEVSKIEYDENFEGLREFIMANMDGFKTAYARPRTMLFQYVTAILDTFSRLGRGGAKSMNFLRGYLDDSMINYLAGDAGTINVKDMKTRGRTGQIKSVPKIKKTHISLCLALGMSVNEINEYLDLMGYAPLNENSDAESRLIMMLKEWEQAHPLQWEYKKKFIKGEESIILKPEDELKAASEMLMLRQDLKYEYTQDGIHFPYMKD